ncbi:MAG: ABC transporter substrate-binding protein [Planctomycetota bacterium]
MSLHRRTTLQAAMVGLAATALPGATSAKAAKLYGRNQAGQKMLRIPVVTAGPGSLDPVLGSTVYDNQSCSQFYETLLQFKYLARPLQLEPLLLAEMPVISDDGLEWSFKLRDDVFFSDDPCFPGGKGRKMTSKDVFYSWMRNADPANRFKNWNYLDGLIVGLDEYRARQIERADNGEPANYDEDVEGLIVLSDTEFKVKLKKANEQFKWYLSVFPLAVVAREAVETYGPAFNRHPVGTGPFILKDEDDWKRGIVLTLHKNPTYRDVRYPTDYEEGDKERGLLEAAGQRIPFLDVVEFRFYEERQPMWLQFKAGQLDYSTVPEFGFEEAFSRRTKELKRSWTRKDIDHQPVPLLDFIYRGFNMDDPVVGGYSDKQKALRQAICLATDWVETNESRYNGKNIIYDGPIPPGVRGHPEGGLAPNSVRGLDLEKSRKVLRDAGWELDADGKIVGLPVVRLYTSAGVESVRITELTIRQLDRIGVRINPQYLEFPVLSESLNNRKAPMFSLAWSMSYPDAEYNFAMFYGPNEAPGINAFLFKNDEYDNLYEQIRITPEGPELTKMHARMQEILQDYAPFCGSMARTRDFLIHPWVKNMKADETFYNWTKYLDVDRDHEDRPA